MRLIAIGRMRAGPEAALFARYAARIRPRLDVTQLPDGSGAPAEIKRREAAALLAALPKDAIAVVLDQAGVQEGSAPFAARLEAWLGSGRPLCFVIGGAEGLDRAVLNASQHLLSFGPMTWPHMLVRVMLAEQVFRARSIAAGHPYHRAGRPE